jgi:nucleoid DNA-binding protein
MHGLINRSIQCFVQDTYGAELWADVAADAGLRAEGFEALLIYDDALTEAVLTSVSRHLKKSREVVLEDLGTFLVSHANLEPLRRLLRFGGENFMEFLHSLDDLADRARLAVPDLDLPDMEIVDEGPSTFRLLCRWHFAGSGHVMLGILRAMADDYGALVLLEYLGEAAGRAQVQVELLDCRFAEGRSFKLAMPAG